MKLRNIFIILSVIVLTLACSKPKPGSNTVAKTTINLDSNYLGLYEEFFQGSKNMEISIDVDNLNANMEPVSNFSNMVVIRSNSNNLNNLTIENVDVPDSGSYAITIGVRGVSCYENCNLSNICERAGDGIPRFRDVITKTNTTSVPNSIFSSPDFIGCL